MRKDNSVTGELQQKNRPQSPIALAQAALRLDCLREVTGTPVPFLTMVLYHVGGEGISASWVMEGPWMRPRPLSPVALELAEL